MQESAAELVLRDAACVEHRHPREDTNPERPDGDTGEPRPDRPCRILVTLHRGVDGERKPCIEPVLEVLIRSEQEQPDAVTGRLPDELSGERRRNAAGGNL
jgi:hypothetical protein